MSAKSAAAIRAERSGLISHDDTSCPSVFRSVGRPVKRFHPTIAPTIAWVIDTGSPLFVSRRTTASAAASATMNAPAGASIAPSRPSVFDVPCAPATAPMTTKTLPTSAAVRNFSIFVPTAVPNRFAASLAPRDQPRKRPLVR